MVRYVVTAVGTTTDQTRGAIPRFRGTVSLVSNVPLASRCRLLTRPSYQVPKEVGKVGTESPTYIQPIAGRKDGIQAMFAKQAASTSSQQSNGAKRKRSASPKSPVSTMQGKKAMTPANKLNTWEDDSEIEYIDGPSSADKVRRPRSFVRTWAEGTVYQQPKAEIKQDQSNVSSLSSTPKKVSNRLFMAELHEVERPLSAPAPRPSHPRYALAML